MKKKTCSYIIFLVLFFIIIEICTCVTALAEVKGPGWFLSSAKPVSLGKSKVYYESLSKKTAPTAFATNGMFATLSSPTEITPEIQELARALDYNPRLFFDYIYNRVEYESYFGALKGATKTLLDNSGNDFDQASLMVALLRESGYEAKFVYGIKLLNGSYLAQYLGVTDWDPENREAIIDLALQVWGSGGVPAIEASNGQGEVIGIAVYGVWIKVTIDEIEYFFDPSYKSVGYTHESGIDLGTAMGYSRVDILNTVSQGATVTDDFVKNMNETNLNTKLEEYSSNLVTVLRAQYPNSNLKEVVGGRQIVGGRLVQYQTTPPYQVQNPQDWSEIPPAYIATLRIQHEGIDCVFQIPEITGKRITVTYAGGSFIPELRVDGELMATGNGTTQGNLYDLIISVDHPYAANGGIYMDQTATYTYLSGSTNAVVLNFGSGLTDKFILRQNEKLARSLAIGLSDESEPVLGEALNIIGLSYIHERQSLGCLLSKITKCIKINHHTVAMVSQEDGYLIDVRMSANSGGKKEINSYIPIEDSLFGASFGSAFEHAVFEQLFGSDKPAVSTIKLMQIANIQGGKIFLTNSENFSSILPQLQNYSDELINQIQGYVGAGWDAILPDNGQIIVNQYKGAGIALKYIFPDGTGAGLSMLIGGGYFGGCGTIPGQIDPVWVSDRVRRVIPDISYDVKIRTERSEEPIDMTTGAYLYDRSDIILGGTAPMGLAFRRSYNSSRKEDKRSMGHGWQHNYDIFLKRLSDGSPGLGFDTPVDAAAMITSFYIAYNLIQNEDNIAGWMTMFMTCKWGVDQLIDNAISVNIGGQVAEYVKLPDGTYNSPSGIITALIDNGNGTFSLKERFGTEMHFDVNDRITQLLDVDGNTLSFAYLNDRLRSVHDEAGRSLTFEYVDDSLTSVTDSEGRDVGYVYGEGDDLVSYTDIIGKSWAYSYDDEHRMTSISNPLGIVTVTNTYDALGRVKTQVVPRDGDIATTYNFYFSGLYNLEEDPYGNRTIYYLDDKSRTYAMEDAFGNIVLNKTFDGQNHVVGIQNALGNSTFFAYDGNHNLINVKNALNKEVNLTHDEQFRLTDITDPLGHIKHFGYDSEHHLTQVTDAINNASAFAYYPDGKVKTITDARGTTTTNTYDSKKNPLSSITGFHPAITYQYDAIGRMISLTDQEEFTTTFTYDSAGHLLTRTDPLGKALTFTYDDAGRIISRTDRNGDTTAYTYTPLDKLKTITYSDSSVITFNYDLHDKLVSMEDATGTTVYVYDKLYRLESLTNPQGQILSYEHDKAGNVTKIIYPGNKDVTYTYDILNRIETVTDWQSNVATYNYDDVGRLTSVTNFNGTVTNYTYDNADRLVALENKIQDPETIISSYAYMLDESGNKIQIVQDEPLAPLIPEENTDLTYNLTKNRLLSAGLTNFAYDDEGQLTTKGASSYTFDYEHRLKTINGSDSAHFVYDGKGNRIEASRNGVITRYIYDAKGNLLAEADSNDNITRYYIYGRGLLAMVTPEGQTYTYHYNGIGSTIAITNQEKETVNKYFYTPFGLLISKSEDISQPFTFNGKYGVIDDLGALYYMRARYYDASIGRFISEDPIGFAGGQTNLYAYVGNNPVNRIDPFGLCGENSNASANAWSMWSDFVTPDFSNPTSLSANFWLNIHNEPPTAGFSFTILGMTTSVNTNGVNSSITPTTLVGASLDFQSWSPNSNWVLTFGVNRHFSIGTYPLEEGVNPWAVHYGGAISVPFIGTSVKLAGSDYDANLSGILTKGVK